MSDEQHEPSYYEIALTGKQVTGAFVVVLVCLLVAFFAGVWIGRGAPREVLADDGTTATNPTPAAKDELSFFADRPAEPAAQKPPMPTVSPIPAPTPPLAEPRPEPEPEPVAVPEPPAPEPEPVKADPPKPEPARTAPPKPEPAATKPPAATPAPVSGPLVIQVFTSSDEAKAKDMLKKLKAKSFKAYLSPTKSAGKTVYRVRVGPFQKEADAKTTSAQIKKQFKVDPWITRSP